MADKKEIKVEKETLVKDAASDTAVKKTVKKPGTRRRSTRTTKVATSVTIEFQGKQVKADEVVAKIFETYNEPVKTLDVYIKPEENVAYFVVDGEGADNYKVEI